MPPQLSQICRYYPYVPLRKVLLLVGFHAIYQTPPHLMESQMFCPRSTPTIYLIDDYLNMILSRENPYPELVTLLSPSIMMQVKILPLLMGKGQKTKWKCQVLGMTAPEQLCSG